ncbi:MAG: hypothetical protein MJE66_13010 [Proteobacteria bacterium]|nr:hypothetical protein [Pseudomonadota bacterium]
MGRGTWIRTQALATATLGLMAWAAVAQAEADHASHRQEIVAVTATRLVPTVLSVSSQDAFGWLNYSPRQVTIAFDAEVAKELRCTGPSGFQVDDDTLRFGSLTPQGFATLCRLAPGEYDYRVEMPAGDGAPERTLVGKIVVQ